jgi:hypothetical protein
LLDGAVDDVRNFARRARVNHAMNAVSSSTAHACHSACHSLIRLPMPYQNLADLSRASLRLAVVVSLVWHASLAASAQTSDAPAPASIATVALHVEPPTQTSPVVPVPPSEQYAALYRDVQLAHL